MLAVPHVRVQAVISRLISCLPAAGVGGRGRRRMRSPGADQHACQEEAELAHAGAAADSPPPPNDVAVPPLQQPAIAAVAMAWQVSSW